MIADIINKRIKEEADTRELRMEVAKAIRDTHDVLLAKAFNQDDESDQETSNLEEIKMLTSKVTALPPIKKMHKPVRSMPGVSYLATSGLYEEIVGRRRR